MPTLFILSIICISIFFAHSFSYNKNYDAVSVQNSGYDDVFTRNNNNIPSVENVDNNFGYDITPVQNYFEITTQKTFYQV